MKTIVFHGHSDDTAGWSWLVDGRLEGGDDHDDCAQMKPRTFRVDAGGEAVHVTLIYSACPTGVWSIGLAPADEDVPMPRWAEQPLYKTHGYTPHMVLVVPDDAKVTLAQAGNE